MFVAGAVTRASVWCCRGVHWEVTGGFCCGCHPGSLGQLEALVCVLMKTLLDARLGLCWCYTYGLVVFGMRLGLCLAGGQRVLGVVIMVEFVLLERRSRVVIVALLWLRLGTRWACCSG